MLSRLSAVRITTEKSYPNRGGGEKDRKTGVEHERKNVIFGIFGFFGPFFDVLWASTDFSEFCEIFYFLRAILMDSLYFVSVRLLLLHVVDIFYICDRLCCTSS